MRIATIDIGTNSILLLIADVQNEKIIVIEDIAQIVRIGKDISKTKYISKDKIKEGLNLLKDYVSLCKNRNVDLIKAVGTAALREAKNAKEFLDIVKEELNLNIKIISPFEEAYLTYLGVKTAKYAKGDLFIVDIGGGSTEFIITFDNNFDTLSLNIGSVKLTEKYIHSDPPSSEEVKKVENEILRELERIPWNVLGKTLIGVAGTVTTLGAIYLKCEKFDPEKIDGLKLSFSDIESLRNLLLSLKFSERKKLKGLEEKRADVIPVGATILYLIMKKFDFSDVIVSNRGVRYGLLRW